MDESLIIQSQYFRHENVRNDWGPSVSFARQQWTSWIMQKSQKQNHQIERLYSLKDVHLLLSKWDQSFLDIKKWTIRDIRAWILKTKSQFPHDSVDKQLFEAFYTQSDEYLTTLWNLHHLAFPGASDYLRREFEELTLDDIENNVLLGPFGGHLPLEYTRRWPLLLLEPSVMSTTSSRHFGAYKFSFTDQSVRTMWNKAMKLTFQNAQLQCIPYFRQAMVMELSWCLNRIEKTLNKPSVLFSCIDPTTQQRRMFSTNHQFKQWISTLPDGWNEGVDVVQRRIRALLGSNQWNEYVQQQIIESLKMQLQQQYALFREGYDYWHDFRFRLTSKREVGLIGRSFAQSIEQFERFMKALFSFRVGDYEEETEEEKKEVDQEMKDADEVVTDASADPSKEFQNICLLLGKLGDKRRQQGIANSLFITVTKMYEKAWKEIREKKFDADLRVYFDYYQTSKEEEAKEQKYDIVSSRIERLEFALEKILFDATFLRESRKILEEWDVTRNQLNRTYDHWLSYHVPPIIPIKGRRARLQGQRENFASETPSAFLDDLLHITHKYFLSLREKSPTFIYLEIQGEM